MLFCGGRGLPTSRPYVGGGQWFQDTVRCLEGEGSDRLELVGGTLWEYHAM